MLLSNFGWTGGGTGGGGGSGTVTLITASTGMNFSPITTTGGIAIDTTQVPYFSGGFGAGGLARFSAGVWSFDTNTYLTAATLTGLDVTNALGYTPVNKAGDTMGGYLILNADPISPLGAATKQYVDNISGGINFHEATYAASTTNLVATYYNGLANDGVGATLTATSNGALILDGVDFSLLLPPTQPYRVLIWQQTNQIENGIYVVTSAGSPTSTWQLTRASDADNSPTGELAYGDFSLNINGTQYGGYGFIMNATGTINIGSSNITYVQYNIAQGVIAGTGLTELPANTLNIDTNQVPYYSGGFGGGGFAIYSGGNWTFDTNTYLTTVSAAATYLTIANAATTYYPLVGNPSGFLTSASLSGYVPYTGATTNVDLGVHNLTTPLIYGSTIASSNLTLSSTSNVTKGKIVFGTSAYDEVNNRLGIGTNTPSETLEVNGNLKTSNGGMLVQGAFSVAPTGAGFELEYALGVAYVTSYNRTSSSWLPMQIRASNIDLNSAATTIMSISSSGVTIFDKNIILGSTTGTKFGTATSQKIGFFNATPIPQPPATSTPQGIADALTSLGLLATSTIYIWNVTTQTGASYNAANNDYVVINATTFTVNLPAISTAGVRVGIKMVAIPASSTAIQVLASSATAVIDGQVSNVLNASTNLYIYNQWDAYTLVSYSDGGVFKWAIES